MMSQRSPLSSLIILLLLICQLFSLNLGSIQQTHDQNAETKVYVVYMGKTPHDNVELITSSHHKMLTDVLGSEEASVESMIYSYRHGFSGFAAKLTDFQAKKLSESYGVIHVIPNHMYKLQTTRSWNYLGLSPQSPSNLLHDTNMGEGAIIGMLDTGIWPDHKAFSDDGLGPIPSKWKGTCESGPQFNATKSCNKKIIGAQYFIKDFLAEYQNLNNTTEIDDPLSPVDTNGHGTHTASIASGSFLSNVSYYGLGHGTARGGAPRARLAIYKVCWNTGRCAYADILKAFDKAIYDGVDVLSISLGLLIPLSPEIRSQNAFNFASLHAVEKGIVVVCAASNFGPTAQTVTNIAPWILTVAASTIDRSFPMPILLGNNETIMGEAIFTGNESGFRQLIYPEVSPLLPPRYCESLRPNDTWIRGKVVLCFHTGEYEAVLRATTIVQLVGGKGIIIAKNPTKFLDFFTNDFPCVQVSYDIGTKILNYIRSTRNPLARLRRSRTYIGKPVSTKVAYFSSRGPNSLAPAILKPDVAAPGVNILGAIPPVDRNTGIRHLFLSGTSMATPHVSGIVALLKCLHPHWSPAALKSAILTTASTTDFSGEPIFAEGDPTKLADPFDFGGGIVNPNKARDPGLVYDMDINDYVYYLCAMGYNTSSINQILGKPTKCPKKDLSILDLNLPSITIPTLTSTSITLRRTVTNVGPTNSTYKAIIEPPQGIIIRVIPDILVFNSKVNKISFSVTVETSYKINIDYCFGSLTWNDGKHEVRTPISVRTEFLEFYAF